MLTPRVKMKYRGLVRADTNPAPVFTTVKMPPHPPQAMGHEQPITFSQWRLFWRLRAFASLRLAWGG